MSQRRNHESLKAAWDAVGRGDWDSVAAAFTEDMLFVLPGQNDVIGGRSAFRSALDSFGEALPPGFKIDELRYCIGEDEIVNVVRWTSDKLPESTQSAVLFKFNKDGLITEERWFIDTEQWKAAF
jgi:ketosteroid isomerase-like protein